LTAGTEKPTEAAAQLAVAIGVPFIVSWPAVPRLAPGSVTAVPGAALAGSGVYKVGVPKVTSFLPR